MSSQRRKKYHLCQNKSSGLGSSPEVEVGKLDGRHVDNVGLENVQEKL